MRKRSGPRLFVSDDLGAECPVALSSGQAHYLRNVMRLSKGDTAVLFNGRDGEWAGSITESSRGACSVLPETQTRPQQAEPDIWLLFAPIKRAPLDFLVQKSVELGVSRLWPVLTRRTDVGRINLDRVRSTSVEAAEQCYRLTLPDICEPIRLEDLSSGWPEDRRLLLCAESAPVRPIAEILEDFRSRPAGKGSGMALLTGPEGGFTTSELDGLRKLPFVTAAGLGPRVLRAETAALAALACWQSVLGDWHSNRVQPPKAT